jgi:Xaa-Pro aminopeptidase
VRLRKRITVDEAVGAMGFPRPPRLVLSKIERACLRKASEILTEIREHFQAELGEDNDEDTDIALAAVTCMETAEYAQIEIGGIE